MARRNCLLLILGLIALLFAPVACAGATQAPRVSAPTVQPPATTVVLPAVQAPTETPVPSTATPVAPTPLPPTVTPDPTEQAMPPEPQEVHFQSRDGHTLVGVYYPGATRPSPLVVLMHWAPGDASEWDAIAPWLQNRGSAAPLPPSNATKPWLDDSWFPHMPEERSFAVLTFTFRGCEGGCRELALDKWLLDAQAAMHAARELPGVDTQRIVAIGASIGADGAADGCYLLNKAFPGSCQGALSLSPGSYLTVPYGQAVAQLGADPTPRPAWCFYAVGDKASAQACKSVQGPNYRVFDYQGKDHGMQLVVPAAQPAVLPLVIEFLESTLGP